MPLWAHWDCETLVKSKTEERCFEKVSPQLGGWLVTMALATDPDIAQYTWGVSYSPVWLWFCHQQHTPRYPRVIRPTHAWFCHQQHTPKYPWVIRSTHATENRYTDLSLAYRDWSLQPMNQLQPLLTQCKSPWVTLIFSITYGQDSLCGSPGIQWRSCSSLLEQKIQDYMHWIR